MPLLKEIEITGIAARGKALARAENRVVFCTGAVPGDVVDLKVTRKRKKHLEAVPVFFHKYSGKRAEPFCRHFGTCGGCRWQNLKYEEQLRFKQQEVTDAFERIAKIPPGKAEPILPSGRTRFYRNKLEYTFSNRRWLTEDEIEKQETIEDRNALGFHVPGMFSKVVDIRECFLQSGPSDRIRSEIRRYADERKLEFYDITEHKGLLRNLIIRTTGTNETMVVMVFGYRDEPEINGLMEHIASRFPEVTSLMVCINPKLNDAIHDLEVVPYRGKDHITEEVNGLKFRIGAKSFFQTNTLQAEKLYRLVADYAGLTGRETVWDLYTGTGSIANFIAGRARKVTGIENIREAVRDARENAALNGITNTTFIEGDAGEVISTDIPAGGSSPQVVITDPPRAGMHKNVLRQLLSVLPERIVYVSCNPATQARDVAVLGEQYALEKIRPVDMFPHTFHVENVALLTRKDR